MAQFLRDMPEGSRRHAQASAPTLEESPGGFEDRELDTVDREMAGLLRDQTEWRSSAASSVTHARGRTLGRYLVLGELGSGGMGTVLKAYDESLDRAVAIKLLHSATADRHTERLRREAQALARLSHPNVVQVYEVGQHDGQWFIAMELVGGQTLGEWRETPRGWRECVEVYLQAGAGLAAAHAAGLVHRDFKPHNCIVDGSERPRVLDFGLVGGDVVPSLDVTSEGIEPIGLGVGALESSLTESGTVLGTPAYMPPEQMRGEEADARSDQFSFCVSLYEAVYGERPFEGGTMAALREAVFFELVRVAPKGVKVPGSLRQILLRGLAADPMHRWPSMETLLAELRRLVTPRRGRWLALSAGLALGLTLVGVGLAYQADMGQRCTGAQAQLDGIWDNARRHTVEAAILGTEASYAPGTWARVESRLDAYADAWMSRHTEVCEATSVRGEQSEEVMSLRMRCLDQRRTLLRASVDVLAGADTEVVTNAVKLVAGLPPLTRCDDLDWLEQQAQRMPPPEDSDVAAEVEALREHLADIEAMDRAGRYAEALEKVEPMVPRAVEVGYLPLLAEAQHWRGVLQGRNGHYAEAEQNLRRAHTLAVEHHHDDVALGTAQALTGVVGYHLARHAEGLQWGQMAALPLAQRSCEPVELATSLNNLGIVYDSQGKYEEAQRHHERALGIWEEAMGASYPHVAMSQNNLGNVYSNQGEYEKAQQHHERALGIWKEVLGADHPDVAMSQNNLGGVYEIQGEYEKAQQHHEQALGIWKEALGGDHPHIAMSLTNLGNSYSSQGKYEEAKRHYQQAIEVWENALGAGHPYVATGLNNLGNAYSSQGEYEEAQRHHERALGIWKRTLGADHPHVATSLNNLGYVCFGQKEYKKAKGYYKRALVTREKALGTDHPRVASSLVGLATAVLKTGDPEFASAHAERAVSIREAASVAPELLAEARFVLAQALWSERHERARARALAELAREVLTAAEGPGESDVDLDDVNAWLATHRVK